MWAGLAPGWARILSKQGLLHSSPLGGGRTGLHDPTAGPDGPKAGVEDGAGWGGCGPQPQDLHCTLTCTPSPLPVSPPLHLRDPAGSASG